MSKKGCALLLSLLLVISMVSPAWAAPEITVTLDGETLYFDVPPTILEGRTMVPIRAIFESLGVTVDWDQDTRTVIATKDDIEVILSIGSSTPTVNGVTVNLDVPGTIVENRTMVPARFVAESFGAEVTWDSVTRTVAVRQAPMPELPLWVYQQPVEGEAAVIEALNPSFGWNFAMQMAEIGSHRGGLGFRMGGTPAGTEAAQLTYDAFKEMGLEPEFHTFTTLGWDFFDATFTVENQDIDVPVVAAPGTVGTVEAGVTGEIVFVGNATIYDLEDLDLTGKIALINMDLDYTPWHAQTAIQAYTHGAAGVIFYSTNYYGQHESGEAFYISDWSGPRIDIPVVNTPRKYGEALAELVQQETVIGTIMVDAVIYEESVGYNVLAKIEGSKYPDEYVTIGGHTDAYFYGFQDDALAVALPLTLAKAMVESGYQPDRTIVFAIVDAEEFGDLDTIYDWLVGSWNLVNDKIDEWGGKVVAHVNLEMMAHHTTEQLEMYTADPLFTYLQAATEAMEVNHFAPGILVNNHVNTWTDEWSYSYHGIPTVATEFDEEMVEMIYHSQFDDEDHADFDLYTDCVRIYSTLVMRFDKMPLMPYDLSLTPDKYLNDLDQELLETLGLGDNLGIRAAAYQQLSREFLAQHLLLTEAYDQAVKTNQVPENVESTVTTYNQALRDTARTLLTGAQYMDLESVSYGPHYYLSLYSIYEEMIEDLEAGDGEGLINKIFELEIDRLDLYYALMLHEEGWKATYWQSLDPDNAAKLNWAQDRVLKLYDVHQLLHGIMEKSEEENDYSVEILAFRAIQEDIVQRLSRVVAADTAMWNRALNQLPSAMADEMMEALITAE